MLVELELGLEPVVVRLDDELARLDTFLLPRRPGEARSTRPSEKMPAPARPMP